MAKLQTLIPGLAFRLAHAGYLNQGFLVWLGIVIPTAFLGMMWGLAYVLGRRGLIPVIVAHFLKCATTITSKKEYSATSLQSSVFRRIIPCDRSARWRTRL